MFLFCPCSQNILLKLTNFFFASTFFCVSVCFEIVQVSHSNIGVLLLYSTQGHGLFCFDTDLLTNIYLKQWRQMHNGEMKQLGFCKLEDIFP